MGVNYSYGERNKQMYTLDGNYDTGRRKLVRWETERTDRQNQDSETLTGSLVWLLRKGPGE